MASRFFKVFQLEFKWGKQKCSPNTVKLGFKELLNKEKIDNRQYLINSEQIGITEQFCDDQKVP